MWSKCLTESSKNIEFVGSYKKDALLIHSGTNFTNISVETCRSGITLRDDSHKQKNLKDITIKDFCGDGILICQSNVSIDNVDIRMSRELVSYHDLHRDAIQVVAVDPETHAPDPKRTLRNIHIKNVTIHCVNEGQYKGCQGIFMGDSVVENVTIEHFNIVVDYPEHGITINSGVDCHIRDGIIKSQDTSFNPTLVLENRKPHLLPDGNNIKLDNVVCRFPVLSEAVVSSKASTPPEDGIVSRRTEDNSVQAITPITLQEVANKHQVSRACLETIQYMESKNVSRYKGRVKILWERHVFWRLNVEAGVDMEKVALANLHLCGEGGIINSKPFTKYGSHDAQYAKMKQAHALFPQAALESASYGKNQIMGYHWKRFGFSSIEAFVEAISQEQYANNFLDYWLASSPSAVTALQQQNFRKFCRRYVGRNVPSAYVEGFSKHFRMLVAKGNPRKKRVNSGTVRGGLATVGGISTTGVVVLPTVFNEVERVDVASDQVQQTLEDVVKIVHESGVATTIKDKITTMAQGDPSATMFDPTFLYLGMAGMTTVMLLGFGLIMWRYSVDNGYV